MQKMVEHGIYCTLWSSMEYEACFVYGDVVLTKRGNKDVTMGGLKWSATAEGRKRNSFDMFHIRG